MNSGGHNVTLSGISGNYAAIFGNHKTKGVLKACSQATDVRYTDKRATALSRPHRHLKALSSYRINDDSERWHHTIPEAHQSG